MIDLIIKSIRQIPAGYYAVTNPLVRNGHPTGYSQTHTHPERNFVSQLYSKLQSIISDRNNLQLNTEIYKCICEQKFRDNRYLKSISAILDNQNGLFPDLIYHQGQHDTNAENQIFALECKIDPELSQKEFNRDIIKLMMYKHELNFQTVIFLVANTSPAKIEQFIKTYESSYYINRDRLHIILVEKHGSDPVCLLHTQGKCT